MSHRVIAGTARGRRLKLVPGDSTRPIMDRAKEALFSILAHDIIDANILDLFAGTGAVGIEALSRGAAHALFLDLSQAAVRTIRDNLEVTRLSDRATVLQMDAFELLKRKPRERYDFIYIAPPQYKGLWRQALLALEANPDWLPEGVEVIVQIDPREQEAVELSHLTAFDERRYGKTLLWFFCRSDEIEEEA
jgi:16S rRNA (guanine966-N2)-methyltransferase